MCGIVGCLAFNDFQVGTSYLTSMRDAMLHRGPDGAGLWISDDARVGFGHRRLSIIDLSSSATQPMRSADGRWVLTFNGEIYNHREIRKKLIEAGVTDWVTDHSDTEVLLNAFRHWGIDCLVHLRGMFAFAIWDTLEKSLWLVRDRIGIKPLYYSFHHGRLTFASEIKALLQDAQQPRAVDEAALFEYLSFLTPTAPKTLFKGIGKLPPATWMRITEKGDLKTVRYWDVWDHVTPLEKHSSQDISDMVLAELKSAVRLRKESDVPVGVFLSGGIDSSTNAALFSENGRLPVRTFSIGYDGDYASYQSELHYAKAMAEHVHAEYHEQRLTQHDLIDFLPKMVQLQDEPIADPVCVPVYFVSKLAKSAGVTVCQVGEGADELFCGYTSWKVKLALQKLNDSFSTPRLNRFAMRIFNLIRQSDRLEYEWLRRAEGGRPIFWGGAEAFTDTEKFALFSPALRAHFKHCSGWDALKPTWERYRDKAWEITPLNWMSYLDLSFRLPELLLMRVDKMSMGVSLEGRVPFLDHRFVELAMSIPSALKTKGGQLKAILKQAVRGVIPDEMIDRKKQGFGVPIYEWFDAQLGVYAREQIVAFNNETGYFDPVQLHYFLTHARPQKLWYLLNLALWWQTYIRGTK